MYRIFLIFVWIFVSFATLVCGTTNSSSPSVEPSFVPSVVPSGTPSVVPSGTPSVVPSATPSVAPTVIPSSTPSVIPSPSPSVTPSFVPSRSPSVTPTYQPSGTPVFSPTCSPTVTPTYKPTITPTKSPTFKPTKRWRIGKLSDGTAATETSTSSSYSKLSTEVLVGVGFASLFVVLSIAALIYYYCHLKRNNKIEKEAADQSFLVNQDQISNHDRNLV